MRTHARAHLKGAALSTAKPFQQHMTGTGQPWPMALALGLWSVMGQSCAGKKGRKQHGCFPSSPCMHCAAPSLTESKQLTNEASDRPTSQPPGP